MTDSLRILLDIGDLVEAGSCQSLKRGGYTQTVQAPAVDAHTKAAVAFKIGLDQLSRNPERAKQMLEAIQAGTITTEFDHSSLTLALIEVETGTKVFQTTFKHGVARELVRVGRVTGKKTQKVKLKTERKYEYERHPEIGLALDRVVQMIGIPVARDKEALMVAETRSPGGAYADSAGGVQKHSYLMGKSGDVFGRGSSSS